MRRTKKTTRSKPATRTALRKRPAPKLIASVDNKPAAPAERAPFAIGDRVSHPQFGNGIITDIESHKLTINFDAHGSKHIIDSYVKPQKA